MIGNPLQMAAGSTTVVFGIVVVTATIVVLAATVYGLREAEQRDPDRGLSTRQALLAGGVTVVIATVIGIIVDVPAAAVDPLLMGAIGISAVVAAYLAVRGRLTWTLVMALAILVYMVAALIWM